MSKQNQVVNESVSSLFYNYAGAVDGKTSLARKILDRFPKFLEGVDESVEGEIRHGILLRHVENNPTKEYGYVEISGSRHMIEITSENKDKVKGLVKFNAEIALAFSAQAWGAMKAENKEQYDIIGDWRGKGQKYISNVLRSLKADIARLLKPEGSGRASPDDFAVFVKAQFDKWEKRCKVSSESRGDTTADVGKLKKSVKAFWTEYNKQ